MYTAQWYDVTTLLAFQAAEQGDTRRRRIANLANAGSYGVPQAHTYGEMSDGAKPITGHDLSRILDVP